MIKLLASKMGRRNLLFGAAAVPVALGASGCGYLLYPERKGRTGGNIDTPIFIVDLLWLLPGIVPGVICLIVDFTTGCIYRSGGKASTESATGDERVATAAVHLDGTVVADGQVQHGRRGHLRWNHQVDDDALRSRGRLIVRRPDGLSAQALVSDLI